MGIEFCYAVVAALQGKLGAWQNLVNTCTVFNCSIIFLVISKLKRVNEVEDVGRNHQGISHTNPFQIPLVPG